MKKNVKHIIITLTIIFSIGLFPMAKSADAYDTVLGQGDMVRFMYWLINGPPNDTYPDGHGGPDGGFLGMIRELTGPDALGGGLTESGYTTCSSIPSSGSASMTEEDHEETNTFVMTFGTPVKTIPTGWTGAGSNYDKKVSVTKNGTPIMDIEFNCDTETGWLRFGEADEGVGQPRHIEVYYDTEDSDASKMELYMYYEPAGSDSEQPTLQTEYFAAKFETTANGVYRIWVTRASQDSTTNGFRIAIHGSTAVTGGLASAYMIFENGSYADTSTTAATDTDTILTGDVGCVNFNDGGTVTDGATTCTSNSLAATEAGAPILDSTGNFSIDWVASTMKDNMTTLD